MADRIASQAGSDTAVAMRGIVKRFPGVVANDRVDFTLRRGEVHALLGENGAGKTTLMNVLAGVYQLDDGRIEREGRPLAIHGPRDAERAGIGMVHQELMLAEALTVAENVALGTRETPWWTRWKRIEERIAARASELGFEVDPRAPVWQLSVGERQRVEIVRALLRGASVLLLDEPTAVLGPRETDELFRSVRTLVAEGRSVVLISHKLEEVTQVADRYTVMRRGRAVAQGLAMASTTREELAQLMVGRREEPPRPAAAAGFSCPPTRGGGAGQPLEQPPTPSPTRAGGRRISGDFPADTGPAASSREPASSFVDNHTQGKRASDAAASPEARKAAAESSSGRARDREDEEGAVAAAETVLEVRNVWALSDKGVDALRGISLAVAAGEIVGVAGVAGNGQRELADVLSGVRPALSGEVRLGGQDVTNEPPRVLLDAGLAYVPEDRRADGAVTAMSVAENLALKVYRSRPVSGRWGLDRAEISRNAARLVRSFGVQATSLDQPAGQLSGGSLQRLILARELARPIRVLLAAQPTRGLDVGAARSVRELMVQQRDHGAAIVLISEDLGELMELSDRVVVLYRGEVAGQFGRHELDREAIGRCMAGLGGEA